MATIQDGRFVFGTDNNNVVHQIRNKGYEVKMEQTRIWPGFEISKVPNSLRFTWDSELGGIQGNTPISDNADSETVYEFDPAGGTGRVGVHSIETSRWHRTKFRCLVVSTNDSTENDAPPTSIDKLTYDENGNNIAGTIQNIGTFTYSSLSEFQNSKYGHFISQLKTIEYDGNQIFLENGSLASDIKVVEYIVTPYRNDDSNLPSSNDSIYLHYSTTPNNNVSDRGTVILVDQLYTKLEDNIDLWNIEIPGTGDTRNEVLKLVQFYQKPNILYYVRMAWVKDPKGNYDSAPTISNEASMEYNAINATLWLYIELGISPNGGKTIYWNDSHMNSSNAPDAVKKLGLSTSVPQITSSMLKFEVSGKDASKFAYPSIQGTFGNNASKYVKITFKSYVPNNEDNNTNRHQRYYVKPENLENVHYNASIPTSIQVISGKNYMASSYENPSSPTSAFSNTSVKFKVSRRTDTDPWFSNIKAILSIDKSNYPAFKREKYNGETA